MADIPGKVGGTAKLKVTITKIERVQVSESNETVTKVYYTLTYPGAPVSIRVLQKDSILTDFSANTTDTSWDYETYIKEV